MSDLNPVSPDRSFEALLARYGAPVLLGKKPAALFAGPRRDRGTLFPGAPDMRFLNLARPGKTPLTFAFRPSLLRRTLEEPQVRLSLEGLGYPVSEGFKALLRCLGRRFGESREFPHEIGFFLGYPPPDVLGFMRYRGARCKLCGPWKVYGDVERAAALFREYSGCKRRLLEHLQRGGTVFDENLPALLALRPLDQSPPKGI